MATRIIVEIDGKEVAATTIHPDTSPSIAEGVDVPAVPASFKPPPELLARARALGASSAGPAPSHAPDGPEGLTPGGAGRRAGRKRREKGFGQARKRVPQEWLV